MKTHANVHDTDSWMILRNAIIPFSVIISVALFICRGCMFCSPSYQNSALFRKHRLYSAVKAFGIRLSPSYINIHSFNE